KQTIFRSRASATRLGGGGHDPFLGGLAGVITRVDPALVCHSILARQQEFLEKGIDELKPMMIKEVAEEIGVHPSTVSRAVANKYAHTPQGVFELRYFFSESV